MWFRRCTFEANDVEAKAAEVAGKHLPCRKHVLFAEALKTLAHLTSPYQRCHWKSAAEIIFPREESEWFCEVLQVPSCYSQEWNSIWFSSSKCDFHCHRSQRLQSGTFSQAAPRRMAWLVQTIQTQVGSWNLIGRIQTISPWWKSNSTNSCLVMRSLPPPDVHQCWPRAHFSDGIHPFGV